MTDAKGRGQHSTATGEHQPPILVVNGNGHSVQGAKGQLQKSSIVSGFDFGFHGFLSLISNCQSQSHNLTHRKPKTGSLLAYTSAFLCVVTSKVLVSSKVYICMRHLFETTCTFWSVLCSLRPLRLVSEFQSWWQSIILPAILKIFQGHGYSRTDPFMLSLMNMKTLKMGPWKLVTLHHELFEVFVSIHWPFADFPAKKRNLLLPSESNPKKVNIAPAQWQTNLQTEMYTLDPNRLKTCFKPLSRSQKGAL